MLPSPSFARILATVVLILLAIALGYPAAFIAHHGWNAAAWPSEVAVTTPFAWFHQLSIRFGYHYTNVLFIIGTYAQMAIGESPAYAGGGPFEFWAITIFTTIVATFTLRGGKPFLLRDPSGLYGRAQWASEDTLRTMNQGIEIGIDPATDRPVRIQVEGNLLTIAPPRSGKTGGLIIPNLVMPDPNAWAGPAVVIDPKGDAYRAVRRRREALGRTVRCIDPLNLVGGTDTWNPLNAIEPGKILYLQSMARSLLSAKNDGDAAYFQSRAIDLIVAAIQATIENGRTNPVRAAELLKDLKAFGAALKGRTDHTSLSAAQILEMEPRSRDSLTSTAETATQWLRDERMQANVRTHTFELSELSRGDTDLFIVLPADDTKEILAPYIRWLLADLFASVRKHRPAERIIAFIDEAATLGKFQSIINGVGELPGYGLSIWTFWQTRAQLFDHYGEYGGETMIGTAEMLNIFSLPATLPKENEHWSNAIGTYTGVKVTTAPDATGREVTTRTSEPVRLVPPSDLNGLLKDYQVVFLTSKSYTPDPLKLHRTKSHDNPRFGTYVELRTPVEAAR